MKNLFLLIFCTFILSAQLIAQDDCDKLPKPLPGRLVNDFYGVIGDNSELNIEELLRKYNDSTSIEIAVVTLKDLSSEYESSYATKIGNCWGVGKKKYDNGIVLLVSFEGERKWAIATGKGIEQYLTDYAASSIGQENLIPNLQKGDIDEAFKSTVNAIIKHLGWKSWKMREYWSAWNKETSQLERSYNRKATGRGFGIFFAWVLYLSLLSFIGWCIWNWNKDIKVRAKVKFSIKFWDNEISLLPIPPADKTWPKWALDRFNVLWEKGKKIRADYADRKSEVLKEMKKNPENAYNLAMREMYPLHQEITINIPKAISKLKKEKSDYEKNALSKVEEVDTSAKKTQETLNGYLNKGFGFSDYLESITSEREILGPWKRDLSKENPKPDHFKESYDVAIASQEKINNLLKAVNLLINHHNEISAESKKALNTQIKNFGGKVKEESWNILKNMQKEHPENVWKELEKDFLKIDNALLEAGSSLESAFEKNKVLKVTSLEQAHKIYLDALALIGFVKSTYDSIEETRVNQVNAKKEYKNIESSAKRVLEEAADKCNNSHVKSDAKDLKEEAMNKMKKAENMLSSGIVDWVWLVALLVSIKELAENSYSKASRDISSYNSYHSSYSSSSSSSSSHSSSFGGFGGGSFGGGGAGGHW